jgi:hypothetical protein
MDRQCRLDSSPQWILSTYKVLVEVPYLNQPHRPVRERRDDTGEEYCHPW